MKTRRVLLAVAAAALLLAGVVSWFAASGPDGLERVAKDHGMATNEHPLADWPLADYAVEAVDNGMLSGGLAGVAGVLVVLGLTAGLVSVVRRKTPETSANTQTAGHADTPRNAGATGDSGTGKDAKTRGS